MKTATITYHSVYNYGAVLQAYALQQAQFKLSIDNVIIDYTPEKNKDYHSIKGNSVKIFIVNLVRIIEMIFNFPAIRRRDKKFASFTKSRLQLSKKYTTLEELKSNPPQVSWYIAGSDQLWNVSTQLRKDFFLAFGDSKVKRASFAVSIGSFTISEEKKEQMKEYINRFDKISVREPEAKDYIETLLVKDIPICVNFDPVYLLSKEEWENFSYKKKIRHKYILCYPMSGHPLMQKALLKLKELTGFKIVIITTELFNRVKGDINIRDACVEEFVALVNNAEFILTTSYHGTIFATLFNKNFYSLVGGSAPTRITGLLNTLGLSHRIPKSIEDINLEPIDYTGTNTIISHQKELSINYLSSLIQSETQT